MNREPLKKSALYIVSTPIGNIKDITLRAIEVLSQVDILLVEDTRSVQYLLNYYRLRPSKILSYHAQNEVERIPSILNSVSQGLSIALISEAGTPLISDPGFLLVQKMIENHYPVIPIPGPSALITGLSICGFPLSHFYFAGFLSSKESRRTNQLKEIAKLRTVVVLYESPYRIQATLCMIQNIFGGDTPIFIGREMTKNYESFYRGYVQDLLKEMETNNFVSKGEFVIIVDNTERKKGFTKD